MTTKVNNKSYVIYVISSYGKRLWLSDVGSWVGGRYTFIWEPDFQSAREFMKMKDAKEAGLVATQTLYKIDEFYIAKRVEKSDGTVELQ